MAFEQGARSAKQLQDVVLSHGEASGIGTDGAQSRDPSVEAERVVYNRGLRKLPPRVIRLYPLDPLAVPGVVCFKQTSKSNSLWSTVPCSF